MAVLFGGELSCSYSALFCRLRTLLRLDLMHETHQIELHAGKVRKVLSRA